MLSENFIYFASLLNVIGTGSYVVQTLRGNTRPNRVSWLLWSVAPLIAAAAQFREGVGLITLSTFMNGFMPLLILIASFINRKAYWKASTFDYFCGSISVLALILWLVTGEGLLAIGLSILADLMAAIPTLRKSYSEPESEHPTAFLFSAIASGITLLTIDEWRIENYSFATYILLICVILYSLIRFKLGSVISSKISYNR